MLNKDKKTIIVEKKRTMSNFSSLLLSFFGKDLSIQIKDDVMNFTNEIAFKILKNTNISISKQYNWGCDLIVQASFWRG